MIILGGGAPASSPFKFFTCKFLGKIESLKKDGDIVIIGFTPSKVKYKENGNFNFVSGYEDYINFIKVNNINTSTYTFGEYTEIEKQDYKIGEPIYGIKSKFSPYIVSNGQSVNYNNTPPCRSQEYYYSLVGMCVFSFLIVVFSLILIIKKKHQNKSRNF